MDSTRVKELFSQINVWTKGSERAPHKPLLILYELAKCAKDEPREIPFSQINPDLTELLKEFSPVRKSYHPEYPFWWLQNDSIWELSRTTGMEQRKGGTIPKKSELLKHNVSGGFPEEIYQALSRDRSLIRTIAQQLLNSSCPESIHEDILAATGLDIADEVPIRGKRDPQFRRRIMTAYEHQCAICGFDVRLGSVQVGLEAAHIMWHQAGGPSTENNGLALCVLHHKLFDLGGFTVTSHLNVLISEQLHGRQGFRESLLVFHGQPIRHPQNPNYLPERKYLTWHEQEVFKKPARWLKEARI